MVCESVSRIDTMSKRLVKLRVRCFVRQRRAGHYEEGQDADPMEESRLHSGGKWRLGKFDKSIRSCCLLGEMNVDSKLTDGGYFASLAGEVPPACVAFRTSILDAT